MNRLMTYRGTLARWQTTILAVIYVLCVIGSFINIYGEGRYI